MASNLVFILWLHLVVGGPDSTSTYFPSKTFVSLAACEAEMVLRQKHYAKKENAEDPKVSVGVSCFPHTFDPRPRETGK